MRNGGGRLIGKKTHRQGMAINLEIIMIQKMKVIKIGILNPLARFLIVLMTCLLVGCATGYYAPATQTQQFRDCIKPLESQLAWCNREYDKCAQDAQLSYDSCILERKQYEEFNKQLDEDFLLDSIENLTAWDCDEDTKHCDTEYRLCQEDYDRGWIDCGGIID